MQEDSLSRRIEEALAAAGIQAAVEREEGVLTLEGMVDTEEARQAADDLAEEILQDGTPFENNLEVESLQTSDADGFGRDSGALLMADSEEAGQSMSLEPDLMEQHILANPTLASGEHGSLQSGSWDDGDQVYVPPVDPVLDTSAAGQPRVLGGFSLTSMDDQSVERSSDGRTGDEALADAVRRELREDAITTALDLRVEVRGGVVHLHGRVADLEDAEQAEAVAARLPGVREVVEHISVSGL